MHPSPECLQKRFIVHRVAVLGYRKVPTDDYSTFRDKTGWCTDKYAFFTHCLHFTINSSRGRTCNDNCRESKSEGESQAREKSCWCITERTHNVQICESSQRILINSQSHQTGLAIHNAVIQAVEKCKAVHLSSLSPGSHIHLEPIFCVSTVRNSTRGGRHTH